MNDFRLFEKIVIERREREIKKDINKKERNNGRQTYIIHKVRFRNIFLGGRC